MGIKGLHKGLSFCTEKGNMKQYRNHRIAVDTSSWLHKSVYSVSAAYVESTERNYVDPKCVGASSRYIRKRCQELLDMFRVAEIFLVMDGKRCPLKANESADREKRRQDNLREARAYKRNGGNDKAEEKYKTCIKIKDGMTQAVMAEVSKAFKNDKRVKLVWSPYEADAQLAKLCIDQMVDAVVTEDSDVLVYSVAARVAFPVIFKLDRTSGVCDIISMAWLLEPPQTQKIGKAKSALEGLLLNFASRESKRPGFGARLFVQGCVLAGCDYAANSLPGVGLVNAFKLVRDNSYRNEEVRFKKILDSLPRKVKISIDIDDYESTLAKSEAVFYYHVVLHTNGHYKHIAVPRLSNEVSVTEHCAKDHFPLLSRYEDELNFLGAIDTSRLQSARPTKLPMLPQHASSNNRKPLQSSNISKKALPKWFQPVKKMNNPYSKSEESRVAVGRSQAVASRATKSGTSTANRFFTFARKTNALTSNVSKCIQLPDCRYAKRVFRPVSSVEKLGEGPTQCTTSSFDYGADEGDSGSVEIVDSKPAENEWKQAVRDLYRKRDIDDEDDCVVISKVRKQDGTTEFFDTSNCTSFNHKQHEDNVSDLGDSDFSPSSTVHRRSDSDEVVTESRFFLKTSARRITLEPCDIKDSHNCDTVGQSELSSQGRKRRKTSSVTTGTSRKSQNSFFDDVVDSPPAAACVQQQPYKVGRKLGAPKSYGRILKAEKTTTTKKLGASRQSRSKSRGQMDFYFKPRSLDIAKP
ncbi:MAG: hypothetical protein SGBAC_009374 [Bacillariaceae sp.]